MRPPVQMPLSAVEAITVNGYQLQKVAAYEVTARIVGVYHYRFGRETEVSPLDLALGWGWMADERVLRQFHFSQGRRVLYQQSTTLSLTAPQLASIANTHIIPASDEVRDAVMSLRTGQVVRLRGYLVNVSHEDNWRWNTSLTRDDTGESACEILYVEEVAVFE